KRSLGPFACSRQSAAATSLMEGEAGAGGRAGTTRRRWQVTGADYQRPFGIKLPATGQGATASRRRGTAANCRRGLTPSLVKILPPDSPRAEVQRGADLPAGEPARSTTAASRIRASSSALGRLVRLSRAGQRGVQLAAGADAQFGEYLAQMPFDRARG